MSPFFSSVSRMALCPPCFLVCATFAVCPLCFLVCSDFLNVSSLFSGVSRMWRCVRYAQSVAVLTPWFLVSGMLRRVRLVSCCFQNVAVFQSCFLVCLDCRGVYALFSGVSRIWRCVRLDLWCVKTSAVLAPCFLMCPDFCELSALFTGELRS